MDKQPNLEQELMLGGATAAEARELATLARRMPAMRQLPVVQTPTNLRLGRRSARRRWWVRHTSHWALLAGVMSAGVTAVAVVVVMAQMAIPGEALYSVKRASETVAVRLQPKFHDELMMRRADEVNQLVSRGSSPQTVSATLASYDQAVAHDPAGSYAARDYCAGMLKTAAAQADPATRAQIMQSLSLLKLQAS